MLGIFHNDRHREAGAAGPDVGYFSNPIRSIRVRISDTMATIGHSCF